MKDDSEVVAQAKDLAGNTSEEDTATAGKKTDTTAPSKPDVEAGKDGLVSITLPNDANPDDRVGVKVTPEGGTTPQTVTLTKQPNGSWTSSNPSVIPNVTTGNKATIPAENTSGEDRDTAKSEVVKKLELSLEKDTGSSDSDHYTNNGKFLVANAGNKPWEYSLDGGKTWKDGTGNSFNLPGNQNLYGQGFNLYACVKSHSESTGDKFKVIYDTVAKPVGAVLFENGLLQGFVEHGAKVTAKIGERIIGVKTADERGICSLSNISQDMLKQRITFEVEDKAGNNAVTEQTFNYKHYPYIGSILNKYGEQNDSANNMVKVGGPGAGSVRAGVKVNTGAGNDSFDMRGTITASAVVDLSDGNDYLRAPNLGTGSIYGGNGDDIVYIKQKLGVVVISLLLILEMAMIASMFVL